MASPTVRLGTSKTFSMVNMLHQMNVRRVFAIARLKTINEINERDCPAVLGTSRAAPLPRVIFYCLE